MKCSTCKHWNKPGKYDDHLNIRLCNKTVQLFDAEDWKTVNGETKRVLNSKYKDQMMFTQDASSYCATLYTREDFFCAHWE